MPFITVKDGTEIYYKDWGNKDGHVVTFSHGWPLSSDDFENQMFFLAEKGYRCIAHDRRGHGRSSQPWNGNDMNTYTDDLNELFDHLNLKDVMMVGHSTGGGEVVRFVARHGSGGKVSKAVLISAVPPLLVKTDRSPQGLPMDVFDSFRESLVKDRAQFFIDVPSGPFFGFNRDNAKVSQGMIWNWYRQGMMCGFKAAYDCVKAFSETDFIEDLKDMEIPVLLLHGQDDQVVPIDCSARETIKLLKNGTLKEFPGGPHALPTINVQEVNEELLKFLKS